MEISEINKGLINSLLNRTGGLISFSMIKETSEKVEQRYNKDDIPEKFREGSFFSQVGINKNGSFCFTLKREKGAWYLTSFEQVIKEANTNGIFSGSIQERATCFNSGTG